MVLSNVIVFAPGANFGKSLPSATALLHDTMFVPLYIYASPISQSMYVGLPSADTVELPTIVTDSPVNSSTVAGYVTFDVVDEYDIVNVIVPAPALYAMVCVMVHVCDNGGKTDVHEKDAVFVFVADVPTENCTPNDVL